MGAKKAASILNIDKPIHVHSFNEPGNQFSLYSVSLEGFSFAEQK